MTDVLLIENHGPIRVLTLNRPDKKNAFDLALASALWSGLESASEDPNVRVVIVTAAGSMFTAGADVNLFLAASKPDAAAGDISKVGRLYEPLRASKKPVIAALQGNAVGMGVTMLPHFDMVYAADDVTLTVPFARLGLVVEYGGSHALPRLIGHQRARELLLRGKPLDARTAEMWGLITRVFPRASFMDEVMAVARDLAEQPPGAVLASRELVAHGTESTFEKATAEEDRVLMTRYGSAENVAAVTAFLTSRKK